MPSSDSRPIAWANGSVSSIATERQTNRMPQLDVHAVFDAVVCTQAFHFFDQPAAWAEFRRVLRPGGHAMVGMINPKTTAGSRRFARLGARTSTTPVSFPTAPELRRLATDAGFEVTAQIDVGWRFRRLVPLVLTVGRASSSSQTAPGVLRGTGAMITACAPT